MLAVTVCTYKPGSDFRIRAMYDMSGVRNREQHAHGTIKNNRC